LAFTTAFSRDLDIYTTRYLCRVLTERHAEVPFAHVGISVEFGSI